jgi:hypothetical protein
MIVMYINKSVLFSLSMCIVTLLLCLEVLGESKILFAPLLFLKHFEDWLVDILLGLLNRVTE